MAKKQSAIDRKLTAALKGSRARRGDAHRLNHVNLPEAGTSSSGRQKRAISGKGNIADTSLESFLGHFTKLNLPRFYGHAILDVTART
jgi:hypothetical protein